MTGSMPVEPWEARVGGDLLFNCDYLEARANSRDRREALAAWSGAVRAGQLRLGGAAGAQPVHPPRRRDVRRARDHAR